MTSHLGIDKVINQLCKKNPESRTFNTYLHRLKKKLERLKRYRRTRARDKTIEIVEEMEFSGNEISIPTDLKQGMKI